VLVAWHDFTPGKALFFSFVACLRNWLPFLTYGLCMLIFGALLPGTLLILLTSLLPGDPRFMMALFMLPMFFVYAPSVIASFYVGYRDVFAEVQAPPPIDEEA
jgi:TRAP-type C4-dicarboxylate transport system permease small subunit